MTTSANPPQPPPSTSDPPTYHSYRYNPRHQSWPYTSKDFTRQDESPDTDFYSAPRYVTHIDDNAINLLRIYYAHNLPSKGRILDFCTSWISHFPPNLEKAAVKTAKRQFTQNEAETDDLEVIGMGISKPELDANPILSQRILQDLNTNSTIPASVSAGGNLDASTCVVSIDYLTSPLQVLSSLYTITKPQGTIHLVISNRCFPTKAVGRWLRVGEQERLQMVGDYLWFSGWREIEVLTLNEGGGSSGWFGLGSTDPLWVVRGRKLEKGVGEAEGGAKVEIGKSEL
ncbi:hypothetical protein MMC09_001082 [Bachmanniomyces sp. S44760]|nr:hypothetical protein [Bachmanniomyces sp. S44760]